MRTQTPQTVAEATKTEKKTAAVRSKNQSVVKGRTEDKARDIDLD